MTSLLEFRRGCVRLLVCACAGVLALNSCATATPDSVSAAATDTEAEEQDGDLPVQRVCGYPYPADRPGDIYKYAPVVFVGTLVGVKSQAYTAPPSDEDPDEISQVFDGCEFRVDSAVSPASPKGNITVLQLSSIRGSDGRTISTILPCETAEFSGSAIGDQYLMYASPVNHLEGYLSPASRGVAYIQSGAVGRVGASTPRDGTPEGHPLESLVGLSIDELQQHYRD